MNLPFRCQVLAVVRVNARLQTAMVKHASAELRDRPSARKGGPVSLHSAHTKVAAMLIRLFLQTSVWLVGMAALLFRAGWHDCMAGGLDLLGHHWRDRRGRGVVVCPSRSRRRSGCCRLSNSRTRMDKTILSLFFALYLASFIIMALDALPVGERPSCRRGPRLRARSASWRPTQSSGASWRRTPSPRRLSGYRRSAGRGSWRPALTASCAIRCMVARF